MQDCPPMISGAGCLIGCRAPHRIARRAPRNCIGACAAARGRGAPRRSQARPWQHLIRGVARSPRPYVDPRPTRASPPACPFHSRGKAMIRNSITRRQFSAGTLRVAAAAALPRLGRAQRLIPAVRSASFCHSRRRRWPTSRRGSPPRSSATSSANASWSRTSRGPAALRRRAPCSRSRPTATRSGSSPTAPRSAPRSTSRCRSTR